VVANNSAFWNITPHNPLIVNRPFGGTCRVHAQGRRIIQQEKKNGVKQVANRALLADFLRDLLFDLEDVGDMFHRNVD
jgi:hypothetical protein